MKDAPGDAANSGNGNMLGAVISAGHHAALQSVNDPSARTLLA